jgi:glycosyltransferase involved in cell wall biosynthesis
LKIGIVTSELFAPGITGIGGFGWASKQVARCFSEDATLGVECVLLMARTLGPGVVAPERLHGCRMIWREPKWGAHVRQLRREKFDLLVMIDNQAVYRLFYWALPHTPAVFWIRDPWSPENKAQMSTLRVPGDASVPQGLWSRDLRAFRFDYWASRVMGRKMEFAAPTTLVRTRFAGTYGFTPQRLHDLPNIIDLGAERGRKSARPTVVVVGRLDPVKRPWLAVAVAAQLPEVEFFFLGQNHFKGAGAWEPKDVPPNVHFLGHTDGARKTALVSGAWALLNTSIHEGLPVTFQEALACETPLVSCLDPEAVVSRFGVFVGEAAGDGVELVPRLVEALKGLLADDERRERLGQAGRAWVEAKHNRAEFLAAFWRIVADASVAKI